MRHRVLYKAPLIDGGDVAMMTYKQWVIVSKRQYILDLLREAKGNQCKAAEIAQVHRNTLKRFILESGIRKVTIRFIREAARNPTQHITATEKRGMQING